MNVIYVIDETKQVQLENVQRLFGFCGQISTIEKYDEQPLNYFLITYVNESDAGSAVFMDNTLIDNAHVRVLTVQQFNESYGHLRTPQSNETPSSTAFEQQETIPIDLGTPQENGESKEENKEENKNETREKLNQKAKELSELTLTAVNQIQAFIVDKAVDTRNAIDRMRGKQQLPEYDLPETYTHSDHFEKKSFTIQQQHSSSSTQQQPSTTTSEVDQMTVHDTQPIENEPIVIVNDNNLKKKPLPPIPQPK